MDATVWIIGVTNLATLAKMWMDLRRSSTDLAKSKAELADYTAKLASAPPSPPSADITEHIVIDGSLLESLVDDILSAHRRFVACVSDELSTAADVDREQERARQYVCVHLKKIREFNAGDLPGQRLRSLELSFACGD